MQAASSASHRFVSEQGMQGLLMVYLDFCNLSRGVYHRVLTPVKKRCTRTALFAEVLQYCRGDEPMPLRVWMIGLRHQIRHMFRIRSPLEDPQTVHEPDAELRRQLPYLVRLLFERIHGISELCLDVGRGRKENDRDPASPRCNDHPCPRCLGGLEPNSPVIQRIIDQDQVRVMRQYVPIESSGSVHRMFPSLGRDDYIHH